MQEIKVVIFSYSEKCYVFENTFSTVFPAGNYVILLNVVFENLQAS
jgi:hypothetical protein